MLESRVAFSAACVVACTALSALWVRSYWQYDWLGGLVLTERNNGFQVKDGCLIESANGVLVVVYAGNWRESLSRVTQSAGSSSASPNLRVTGDEDESAWNGFHAKVYPNGMFRGSAPHWFLVTAIGAAAGLPWMPQRFQPPHAPDRRDGSGRCARRSNEYATIAAPTLIAVAGSGITTNVKPSAPGAQSTLET